MKTALTICLIFLLMSSSFAEIYKSIDKDGNVTFSQTPPRNDAPEYKVEAGPGGAGGASQDKQAQPASSDFDKQKRYLDYLTRERLERKEKRDQKKLQKARLRDQCYRARAQLEDLGQPRMAYYDLDKDGNKVIVGNEDIQKMKNQLHNFLSKNCRGSK